MGGSFPFKETFLLALMLVTGLFVAVGTPILWAAASVGRPPAQRRRVWLAAAFVASTSAATACFLSLTPLGRSGWGQAACALAVLGSTSWFCRSVPRALGALVGGALAFALLVMLQALLNR